MADVFGCVRFNCFTLQMKKLSSNYLVTRDLGVPVGGSREPGGNLGTGIKLMVALSGISDVRKPKGTAGFTLVELLVVIAIVGVLAGLLFPAIAKAKNSGKVTACLNNLRQLQLAWTMYADDHDGRLVRNDYVIGNPHPSRASWVQGRLDYSPSNPANTNSAIFLDEGLSLFAPYLRAPSVYRCPSDRSAVRINGEWYSRVRSYGMNWALASERSTEVKVLKRFGEIQAPAPSMMFVFIDQHPDYISDPHFHMSLATGGQAMFLDIPSANHVGSGTLTYADGHAERRKWVDQRTKPEVKFHTTSALAVPSPNNHDIDWLQERYAAPRSAR